MATPECSSDQEAISKFKKIKKGIKSSISNSLFQKFNFGTAHNGSSVDVVNIPVEQDMLNVNNQTLNEGAEQHMLESSSTETTSLLSEVVIVSGWNTPCLNESFEYSISSNDGDHKLEAPEENNVFESISHEPLPSADGTILLIGSTGNGKSTLGNFLLDPHNTTQSLFFKTACNNRSTTKKTQRGSKKLTDIRGYTFVNLTVIDTPGLNEGAIEDYQHMLDLIQELEKVKEISACIFVIKFNARIDNPYRKTIEYYSMLLPSLFENNVFIVMTEYLTDECSKVRRQRQGVVESQFVDNTIDEMVKIAELCSDALLVFKLDCLPLDSEMEESMQTRNNIIEFVLSRKPTKMKRLKLVKPEQLIMLDRASISRCEGKIEGCKEQLIRLNLRAHSALDNVHDAEMFIMRQDRQITNLKSRLEVWDTEDLITTGIWSIDSEWKWFQTQRKKFVIESKWPICNAIKWSNGHCRFNSKQTDFRFEGTVQGEFFRGLYVSVELQTKKCMKFASEIEVKKSELHDSESKIALRKELLLQYFDAHKEYLEEVAELMKCIKEQKETIDKLAPDLMTIEEASRRFKEFF